jgi:hypothetical protein
MQFDASLHANRLIFDDSKKNWDSRKKRGGDYQFDQDSSGEGKKKGGKKAEKKKVHLSNGDGDEYEEELKGGDEEIEQEDSYISAKSINRRELLRKNNDNVERKSINQAEKEQDW